MKTMSKQVYITPETEICVLRMNGQVLEDYTVIDLSNPKPKEVTEGEINSNGGGIWDVVVSDTQEDNSLWDSF